jgi:alpha-glucosidase
VVPIFVREGAVIPTVKLEQYVGELADKGMPNPITLNVYPGKSGEYVMYLDDGVSRSSAPKQTTKDPEANDEYQEVHITQKYTDANTRVISTEITHSGYTPKEQYFFVAVLHKPGEASVKSVEADMTECQYKGTFDELESSDANAAFYNPSNNTTYIKVFNSKNAKKDIVLKSGDNLVSQDELKGAVYRAIERFASREEREASLSLK